MSASVVKREQHARRKVEMARLIGDYNLTVQDVATRLGITTRTAYALWKEIKTDLGPQAFKADLGWRP